MQSRTTFTQCVVKDLSKPHLSIENVMIDHMTGHAGYRHFIPSQLGI